MAPFSSNLNSSSRLDPTHATGATLAGAESISPKIIDPFLIHTPVPRAPFFSTYNVDESRNHLRTSGIDQVPRAPFFSTYNVDESQNHQQPPSHAQVSRAPFFSTYNMDESPNHPRIHSQQSMPTAPFSSIQSSMDLSGYANDDQVASEHLAQQKALSSSSQNTAAPHARAPQLSFGAVNQYPNDAQATSQISATVYENSQVMPYHAGPVQGVPTSGHSY